VSSPEQREHTIVELRRPPTDIVDPPSDVKALFDLTPILRVLVGTAGSRFAERLLLTRDDLDLQQVTQSAVR
jgi:hypothetical protein